MNRIMPYSTSDFPTTYLSNKTKMARGNNSNKGYDNENGAEVYISDEARKLFQALKEYDCSSPLKFNEEFFRRDYYEQRKLEFGKRIAERKNINPLENEFQILGVKYIFNDGTLEQFLSKKLEGKVQNATLLASEITSQIRGTISNQSATIEERAINRETALKLAEYIAQNYFDDADEANDFLREINKYAENDILREKGYIAFDNTDMRPFKSYTLPTAPDNYVSSTAYAKKCGYTDFKDIFNDSSKLKDFIKAVQKNGERWREEIVKDFEENAQNIQTIINNFKNSMSDVSLNSNFIDDMNNSLNSLNQYDVAKWTNNALGLFL
ncbi:hypothetical protein [Clostridium formicaceticum]|uniref:Uncharacterized protein n=1 Tax=Clostridium formicaceticum TaxID=1497 RepID=A0AAC9RQD2_9CLOT|nr:hypothetical protein [Clostridium formicaceticum]AOY74662.1 hypothetical protein BJL90_01030 [Clostridium formicaceticum]ARE89033.1 hypothetical protein CLFO_34390 [Clostridium formicaceticum]